MHNLIGIIGSIASTIGLIRWIIDNWKKNKKAARIDLTIFLVGLVFSIAGFYFSKESEEIKLTDDEIELRGALEGAENDLIYFIRHIQSRLEFEKVGMESTSTISEPTSVKNIKENGKLYYALSEPLKNDIAQMSNAFRVFTEGYNKRTQAETGTLSLILNESFFQLIALRIEQELLNGDITKEEHKEKYNANQELKTQSFLNSLGYDSKLLRGAFEMDSDREGMSKALFNTGMMLGRCDYFETVFQYIDHLEESEIDLLDSLAYYADIPYDIKRIVEKSKTDTLYAMKALFTIHKHINLLHGREASSTFSIWRFHQPLC